METIRAYEEISLQMNEHKVTIHEEDDIQIITTVNFHLVLIVISVLYNFKNEKGLKILG